MPPAGAAERGGHGGVTARRVLSAGCRVCLSGTRGANPLLHDLSHLSLGPAERLEEPFLALDRPEVTLHDLCGGEAVFVETAEECNVYSSTEGSFLYDVQLRNAIKVFYVPISAFLALAERRGPLRCGCLHVLSTGRCGSTLLAQVLETHPHVTSLSEPLALLRCAGLIAAADCRPAELDLWAAEEPRLVLEACVRLLLRDFPEGSLACMKLHSQALSLAPLLRELFPSHYMLYVYRDLEPTVVSYVRFIDSFCPALFQPITRTRLGRKLFSGFGFALLAEFTSVRFSFLNLVDGDATWAKSFALWSKAPHMLTVLQVGSNLCAAFRLLSCREERGLRSLHYEDLVGQPEAACRRLFEFCGLPASEEDIAAAISALAEDSQRGTHFSKLKTGSEDVGFTAEDVEAFDKALKELGLPFSFRGKLRLPGSILAA